MDNKLFEETISSQNVFSGKVINITLDEVKLCNGNHSTREVVNHSGGVCVLPIVNNGLEVILVKQFRYPYKKVILEAPAGKLEHGEHPLDTAKRELREETGAIAENYISLGHIYPSPGYSAEIIYIYTCNVTSFGNIDLDEDEFLNIERIPFDKALEMVMDGSIHDAKTQIAILKYSILNKKN